MRIEHRALITVGLGAGIGLVALALVFGQGSGLGLCLFLVMWSSALYLHARMQQLRPQRRSFSLIVPALLCAMFLLLRADPVLIALNLVGWLASIGLTVYFFMGGNPFAQALVSYPFLALSSAIDSLVLPWTEFSRATKWMMGQGDGVKGGLKRYSAVFRGLAIAIPLMLGFVILFSAADELFNRAVQQAFSLIVIDDFPALVMRISFFGLVTWFTVGALAASLLDHAKRKVMPAYASQDVPQSVLSLQQLIPPEQPDGETITAIKDELESDAGGFDAIPLEPLAPIQPPPAPSITASADFKLGFVESSIALGGVTLVFLAFVAVQSVYLFGGTRNIARFSFAEYARRGFGELVTAAVLTLGLVFVFRHIATLESPQQRRLFNGFGTVLMVLTGIILVSAFARLRLYEQTYGLTTLRLQIYVSILWLGVLLVGMTLALYWDRPHFKWFETSTLFAVFGFIFTLNVINPDLVVANAALASGDVDPAYLSTLSVEAVPVLAALADSDDVGTRHIARETLSAFKQDLDRSASDWRSFTVVQFTALRTITQLSDRGSLDEVALDLSEARFKATLARNMTVRQIIRAFGRPVLSSEAVRGLGEYSGWLTDARSGQSLTLTYRLEPTDATIRLEFDTETGLKAYAICDYNYETCIDQTLRK